MRLIDADDIIDKSYWHGAIPTYDNPFPHGRDAVDVEDIENAQTIDAVPVVRCKDCSKRNSPFCMAFELKDGPQDDDYCSLGEKLDTD